MAESTRVVCADPLRPVPLLHREICIDDVDGGCPLITVGGPMRECIQTNEDGTVSFRVTPETAGVLVKALLPFADVRPHTIIVAYGEKIALSVDTTAPLK